MNELNFILLDKKIILKRLLFQIGIMLGKAKDFAFEN